MISLHYMLTKEARTLSDCIDMKSNGSSVEVVLDLHVDTRLDEAGMWLDFTACLVCRCPREDSSIVCREICSTCAEDCSPRQLNRVARIADRRLARMLEKLRRWEIPVEKKQLNFVDLISKDALVSC